MKFYFFSAVLVFFMFIHAQTKEQSIEVEYKSFVTSYYSEEDEKEMGKEILQAFKNYMNTPKYFGLTANQEDAEYVFLPQIDNKQRTRIRVAINNHREKMKYYYNIHDSIVLESHVWPKKILVKDTLKQQDWKLTRNKKVVCGIPVKEAFQVKENFNGYDSIKITAWYAPSLPFRFGPKGHFGLPGLILELTEEMWATYDNEQDHSKEEYFCNKIDILNKPKAIKRPNDTEAISRQELKALTEEAEKKWEEMYSEGVDTSD